MRRSLVLILVMALAVAACSKNDRPPLERVAGNIGASDASSGTSTEGGTSADGGTAAAAGTADGTAGSGSSTGAGTSPTGAAGDPAARAQAATSALDAYLDALKAEDFSSAQRVSTGGAAFMARVREVVSRYNKERDGVTKLSYSARSFQVASNEPSRVAFTGSAKLDSTTSGPAGDPQTESSSIENPVVAFLNGAWLVSEYRQDGQPLAHVPASAHKTVGGVDLRLPGAVSFGTSTGLIVDLVSDGDHSIKIDKATLTYADGTSATPRFGALVSNKPAALYFLFERAGSTPASWTATVTIDGGTPNETTAEVVLKF